MIHNISIELLKPHPRNPRQDVGDVTELAESIKANGIMQNLTVVPTSNDYYHVVIGNRRLAAAQSAGLEMLPCVVSDMDEKTQQSTMLLENMQRVDLTPYEQAEGFQMCIDFGMNEDELKQKTGFSKQTIKHRLKLLELDKERFKKGVERGASIQDYIDLEQIEDTEEKQELLEIIGTEDFRYKLNEKIRNQEIRKAKKDLISRLELKMERIYDDWPNGYLYVCNVCILNDLKNYVIPADIDRLKYVFFVPYYGGIKIFKERLEVESKKTECIDEEEKEPTQEELNIREIKSKAEIAYKTRFDFIKDIYKNNNFGNITGQEEAYAFLLISEKLNAARDCTDNIFEDITGMNIDDIDYEYLSKSASVNTKKILFALIYSSLESDCDTWTVCDFSYSRGYGGYEDYYKDEIKELYDFLEKYDYQPSQEEKDIMFGTHELYKNTNNDDE